MHAGGLTSTHSRSWFCLATPWIGARTPPDVYSHFRIIRNPAASSAVLALATDDSSKYGPTTTRTRLSLPACMAPLKPLPFSARNKSIARISPAPNTCQNWPGIGISCGGRLGRRQRRRYLMRSFPRRRRWGWRRSLHHRCPASGAGRRPVRVEYCGLRRRFRAALTFALRGPCLPRCRPSRLKLQPVLDRPTFPASIRSSRFR